MSRKSNKPSHQEPEQGDDLDARVNEPYGPGQYRSGVDKPGKPDKKNPGHTNPAHNTPGQERGDRPDVPDAPSGGRPADYPGIKGPKTEKMVQESKPPSEGASDKHPETIRPRERKPN